MKIYKSTLSQLLNEAKPPFYLSYNRITVNAKLPQLIFTVQLSARNEQGEMCELYLSTPTVYAFDEHNSKLAHQQAQTWANELRTRLEALHLEIRDGRVSEEPMAGVIE